VSVVPAALLDPIGWSEALAFGHATGVGWVEPSGERSRLVQSIAWVRLRPGRLRCSTGQILSGKWWLTWGGVGARRRSGADQLFGRVERGGGGFAKKVCGGSSYCDTDAGSFDACVCRDLALGRGFCAVFCRAGWMLDAVNVSRAVAEFVGIGGPGGVAALADVIARGPVSLQNMQSVVRVDGVTELEQYWNFDAEPYQHVWSVTKSIVSTLVGIALSEGIVTSLDQKLATLLPQYRHLMSKEVASITVEQLLTMTSGIGEDDATTHDRELNAQRAFR
jgi:hypothetical protein